MESRRTVLVSHWRSRSNYTSKTSSTWMRETTCQFSGTPRCGMWRTRIIDRYLCLNSNRSARWLNWIGSRPVAITSHAQHQPSIHAFMSGISDEPISHKHRSATISVRLPWICRRIVLSEKHDERRDTLELFLFADSVGDFLWRPNSDNLISVGRSENLVHAPLSSAIKTDQFVSLFSLNVTSKGHVHTTMPNIDDPYVRALYAERHLPSNVTSLKKFYSEEVMSTFLKWNHTISTKSIIGILPNTSADNSVEQFHRFARHWIFGNGDATPAALAKICDINGTVAEKLQRPDLKATWQVIKMIYADHDGLEPYRSRSSRHTPSTNKIHHLSDSVSGHRHHPYHHAPGKNKSGNKEQQQHDFNSNDDVLGRKRGKSQEQIIPANSQIGKTSLIQSATYLSSPSSNDRCF